jgi:hypothetical protein
LVCGELRRSYTIAPAATAPGDSLLLASVSDRVELLVDLAHLGSGRIGKPFWFDVPSRAASPAATELKVFLGKNAPFEQGFGPDLAPKPFRSPSGRLPSRDPMTSGNFRIEGTKLGVESSAAKGIHEHSMKADRRAVNWLV